MDPDHQAAFPNGVIGEVTRAGANWQVNVTLNERMGATRFLVTVVKAGSGYLACGMDIK